MLTLQTVYKLDGRLLQCTREETYLSKGRAGATITNMFNVIFISGNYDSESHTQQNVITFFLYPQRHKERFLKWEIKTT